MISAKPNYLLTFISMLFVFFFLGLYTFIYLQPEIVVDRLKEKLQIVIELKVEDLTIMQQLKDMQGVNSSSITYISHKDAEREMRYEIGPIQEVLEEESPFVDMVAFTVHAQYYSDIYLSELKQKVLSWKNVKEVHYDTEVALVLNQAVKRWSTILAIIGLAAMLVAFIFIYNTMKLRLFHDREEIQTLDLMGATKRFIKRPYIGKAALQGGIAAGIAVLVISILVASLPYHNAQIEQLVGNPTFWYWVGGMILFGILFHYLAAEIILFQFLKGRIKL